MSELVNEEPEFEDDEKESNKLGLFLLFCRPGSNESKQRDWTFSRTIISVGLKRRRTFGIFELLNDDPELPAEEGDSPRL